MKSGRKERIVISCVTFETVKVTDPILHYQATKVHLIRYVKNPKENNVYNDFFNRVCEIIHEKSPFDVDIKDHCNEPVYKFPQMLRLVLDIIQSERKCKDYDCEIFVNISAGTSEFAAAATIASMMVPGTIPFTVNTKDYTIEKDRIKKLYYDEDMKPIGLAKSTKPPEQMSCYAINIPDEHLVRGLRILSERNKSNESVSASKMIKELDSNSLWLRGECTVDKERRRHSDKSRSEAVYYQRDFINKWIEKGWVKKNDLKKRYEVTEAGERILDTFYTSDPDKKK